jgi:transcriptional regulator with XRE-family HTH domain
MAAGERTDWSTWMRELGVRLRRVREFLGLSQEQIARLAGVSQGAVSRLEGGRGLATPMLIVLKIYLVLARALGELDAGLVDDHLRLGNAVLAEIAPRIDAGEPPIVKDRDLDEMIRLYRGLPERQRRMLVAVVRATADSLVRPVPGNKAEA